MSKTRNLNRDATAGYRDLMFEVRMQDFHDAWGTALEWLGAIADVVYVEFGELMPECTPAAALRGREDLEVDSYPTGRVLDMLDDGTVTEDDLRAVYTVMSRYADWVRLAGRDY